MRTDNTFIKLILALCLVGILTSGWLLSIHIRFATGQASLTETCSILGMNSGTGCATIAVSDYSDVLGVPLAAIALGYYFTLLLLVFWSMRNFQMAYESLYVSYFLSTLAILVTVTMFVISRYVLNSFCLGCSILWVVNLLIWPCFVKQLGLNWGNALAANLELFRKKNLQLKRERILGSFVVGMVCLVVFAVVGSAAKSLQGQPVNYSEASLLTDYQTAVQVFLPAESLGGAQSKGLQSGTPILEIVEFADFQCPACRMAAQLFKPFLLKHADKVRLTFHHFPLDGSCNPFTPNGMHSFACSAARTALCAGKQEKFWPVHDLIFDRQADLSLAVLDQIVQEAGLDKAAFDACMKAPATETELQRQMAWGEQIKLESTPTIVINGRKMSGVRHPAELEALLQSLEK